MAIRDWERKALAATAAFAAIAIYAVRKDAPFVEFANAVEWILGIYITGQAAHAIGAGKLGMVAGAGGKPAERAP
jgi:hypothetical protein